MDNRDALTLYDRDRAFRPEEMPVDYYGVGVEIPPRTVESLVTWDVSGHAQCEKDRLSFVYRSRIKTRGGY
jgi:hypothetical protein